MSPAGVIRAVVPALLVIAAVLVQVSVVQRIELGDSSPDIVVLVIVSIALLTNSVYGAAYGFIGGFCVALFASLLLGPHALIATVVGYWAGRWGEALNTDEHPVPPMVAGLVATMAMQVGRPLVEFLLDPSSTGSTQGVVTEAVVVTALNAVLVIPVYLTVRRVIAALPTDEHTEVVVDG